MAMKKVMAECELEVEINPYDVKPKAKVSEILFDVIDKIIVIHHILLHYASNI